jgi:hypothetical protein
MLLMGGVLAGAQQRPANRNPLTMVKRLTCTFTATAVGSWPDAAPEIHVSTPSEPLVLTIADIDTDQGSATIAAAAGKSTATVTLNGSNLYFLDLRPNGYAALTTVFSQETRNKRLKAVHMRTEPTVAQYAGECDAK